MADERAGQVVNMSSAIRIVRRSHPSGPIDAGRMRALVAEFCRMLDARRAEKPMPLPEKRDHATPQSDDTAYRMVSRVSPRMRQTLDCLLDGDQEKQIARRLGVSQHTVHVYIKALYRHYDVNSRAELMSKFVRSQCRN